MTPLEISEYKRKWFPGYEVNIHSDMRSHGKVWCKRLNKQEWNHRGYTDVYQDTFYFKDIRAGQNFEMEFSSWVKK